MSPKPPIPATRPVAADATPRTSLAPAPTRTETRGGSRTTTKPRCEAHSKQTNAQCRRVPAAGATVCKWHGGAIQAQREKVSREVIKEGLSKFVALIPEDDWEAQPMNSFMAEFRRTIGHIRYYEEKIAELNNERSLIFGVTEVADIEASEFAGTNTKMTAGLHVYAVAMMEERKHLHSLQKTWIDAKLDVKKLEIEAGIVDRLDEKLNAILIRLGHDPRNVEVRNIVRSELLALTA